MSTDYTALGSPRISLLPKYVVLVSAGPMSGKAGATSIAWNGVLSSRPPLVGVSFLPDSYCRQQILEYRDFVINVPGREALAVVEKCGRTSGPLESKVCPGEVTLMPSTTIRSPRMSGAVLHLECRLLSVQQFGLYDLMVGLAQEMHVRTDLHRQWHPKGDLDFSMDPPISCLGDGYWVATEKLGVTHENKEHPHGPEH